MTTNSQQNTCLLRLKVTPNAGRNEITGLTEDVLQVRVAAPPVKGKANGELVVYLGKLLNLSRGSFNIVRGRTSRHKVIRVDGIGYKAALDKLLPRPSSSSDATRQSKG